MRNNHGIIYMWKIRGCPWLKCSVHHTTCSKMQMMLPTFHSPLVDISVSPLSTPSSLLWTQQISDKTNFLPSGWMDVLPSLSAFEMWTTKVVQFWLSSFPVFSGFLAWLFLCFLPVSLILGISIDYKFINQTQSLEVELPKSVPLLSDWFLCPGA